MKKLFVIAIGLLVLSSVGVVSAGRDKPFKIGILMWHETEHDEQALNGFKEGIELSGIPHNLDVKRAQGDETKAREFVRQWKKEKTDLICTVGTKGTLYALEETRDIPIVFTAVTNPVVSGIADSWQSSGRNVTGTSNWISSKHKLETFKQAIPQLKTLGVIYNPDNPVPVAEITDARKASKGLGITMKEATIKNVDDIEKTLGALIGQGIDALWVPIEVLVYTNMDRVGRVTIPVKLPVVSSTLEGIQSTLEGEAVGIICETVDYKGLGRLCVSAALEILTEGKDPKEIPIRVPQQNAISINTNAADVVSHKIPPMFLVRADKVLRGFTGQKLVVAGTGDSQDLLRVIAKTLEAKLGGGEIEIPESIGSGGGIRALAAAKANLARVARPLKENEKALGLNYKLFAKTPIVFATHPSVTGVDNIKGEEIVGIYAGRITDWGQLGSKSGKIYAVSREPGDSARIVLNDQLPGFKDITNPTAKVIYSTPEAVKTLVKHRKTIGFLPLSMTPGTGLRILKVDGIYPSAENVRTGKYNLAIPLGIVHKEELKGLARRFVVFLGSEEGKKIISEYGAIPM